MNAVFRRFYLVRWRAAALLCLPGLLLIGWYAFCAFARFDSYRRAERSRVELTTELFQIELHDLLRRDLRRMLLDPPPEPARIEHFAFQISRANLEALERSREREERDYVSANVVRGNALQPVEVRLLGQKPWHVLYKQMSLKVQLPKGDLLDGHRVFTLSNDPSPMVVGEQIILDLLDSRGVLVPRSDFARVAINDTDLGVFRYEAQPEESLLRFRRREPGSMYSGDLPSSARTDELWSGVGRWRKVAWREDEEKEDFSELQRLLTQVRGATIAEFADFARHEIDLHAFAEFEALDIAFGCDQHNFRENHKLYFDPYRGRWEPIAWGFRGFEHDPVFNRVENPLLLRLKLVPGYLTLRNRLLYEFLMSDGSGAAVHARGRDIFRRIGPELATDPYWDAYRLLPRIDEFHRQMVRPMDLARAVLVFESELKTYERRRDFLIAELRRNPLWIHTTPPADAGGPIQVDLIVDGQAGVELEGFRATWPASCSSPSWRVTRGDQEVTAVSSDAEAELTRRLPLVPGVRIDARTGSDPQRGGVRTAASPMPYAFELHASCVPERIEAVGLNLATLSRIRSRAAPPELVQRVPHRQLVPDSVPAFTPGEVSPHPFGIAEPAPEQVQIGPGTVEVGQTRVYEPHQRVRVAPGTRLRMAAGASLVFLGQVSFDGIAREPIVIERATQKPWGGIVLQGPGTRGSSFSHVAASGGSAPAWRRNRYPGMIDLHDTRELTIRNCRFSDNTGSDDLVHAAYVTDLLVEDSSAGRSHADAWDLEFTQAVLRRLQIGETGDDGLDLMGSRVEVVDSVLVGIKGNGISAGEESQVSLQDTLVADAGVGVLAKNASSVAADGSLLFRVKTGVRVYTRTVRYEGDSRIQADVLFVVDSKRAIRRDDRNGDALDLGRVQTRLPRRDSLEHLRDNVLGLADWERLADWLGQRRTRWQQSTGTLAWQP